MDGLRWSTKVRKCICAYVLKCANGFFLLSYYSQGIAIAIVLGRPCAPDLVWLGQKNSTQRIHLRSLVPERIHLRTLVCQRIHLRTLVPKSKCICAL
jgi:hypothetical protein